MKPSTAKVILLGALPLVLAAPPKCGIGGDGTSYYTSKTVKSVSECIYTCEKDEKCLSSEYKPSERKCWLFDKSVDQAKVTNESPSTYVFHDKGCPWVQCGVPGDGSSYFIGKDVTTTDACRAACKADSQCRSFEFRYDAPKCWLYKNPVFQSKTEEKSSNYVFYDVDCPNIQCWVPGDASSYYKTLSAGTAQACQRACKNDEKCLSSEYKKANSKCWLFDKPVAQVGKSGSSPDWIFFDKDCSI